MSSSSSAYSYRPGGSLKFKGSSSDDKRDKKKKKKSKSSTSSDVKKHSSSSSSKARRDDAGDRQQDDEGADLDEQRRVEDDLVAQIDAKEAQLAQAFSSGRKQTESEKKFEEMRQKRMHERIRKEAKLSHKEKVDAFNQYLGSLSEHHDIPKVGPG